MGSVGALTPTDPVSNQNLVIVVVVVLAFFFANTFFFMILFLFLIVVIVFFNVTLKTICTVVIGCAGIAGFTR